MLMYGRKPAQYCKVIPCKQNKKGKNKETLPLKKIDVINLKLRFSWASFYFYLLSL